MRPAINGLFNHMGFSKNPSWGRKGMLASDEEFTSDLADGDWYDYLHKIKWAIAGTPDYVADTIAEFQAEAGMDHLVQYWSVAGLSAAELRRSQELFAEHVMPRFSASELPVG
jgi:alkanesulfonate monooxygenase SsuD/methylene tetrahydromethanopterin reductase-like flavin-dependent oxidoreductase (luciferase family)